MKEKQRIDKILEAVHQQIEEEVGGLIGAELQLTPSSNEIITKEDFFDQPLGKQVFAKIDIVGEVEGKGGLLVSIKDAIRLGGTLIMLPLAELDEVANSESYDGETEDSYGEIANIIAGAYTKTFEEMFPKACRFVRKEQEVLIPVKVDPESDEPIPDGQYYMVSAAMQLDGNQLSNITMLMPAEPFGLVEQLDVHKHDKAQEDSSEDKGAEITVTQDTVETEGVAVNEKSDSGEVSELKEETAGKGDEPADSEPAEQENSQPKENTFDVEKHKQRVDSLLDACRAKVEEEVGALLGVEVSCRDLKNEIVQKEEFFFEEASGKQIVAYLDVVGDMEDKCYLFVGLKDAIRIGSTLIMLPPNELEHAVSEEDFGDDSQDAYGEIANIIAGVYTAVFEEQYIKSFRFIKKELEQVVPMKVDIGSDTPMPDQAYYMSSMKFAMEGNEYGKVQVLFPAPLLQLDALASVADEADEVSESAATEGTSLASEKSQPDGSENKTQSIVPGHFKETDILIVSNSDSDAAQISEVLKERGYTSSVLSFRDNVNNYLPGKFKAVFMVTNDLDEQSFGMTIKISTACGLPLIAAGADWTRTKVIKAVKYGVTDILLIPAEKADIEEKISNNIVKMAA